MKKIIEMKICAWQRYGQIEQICNNVYTGLGMVTDLRTEALSLEDWLEIFNNAICCKNKSAHHALNQVMPFLHDDGETFTIKKSSTHMVCRKCEGDSGLCAFVLMGIAAFEHPKGV